MHDPQVVAFEIRRPWPQRSKMHDADRPAAGGRRWTWRYRHRCGSWCESTPHARQPFPWWKPSSYGAFMTVAGLGFYWPSMVTIWHSEPGGHDSGEVCSHWRTSRNGQRRYTKRWKLHVHHWRIQISPLQMLHRRVFGRCAWCGGRSTKRWPVNVSHQWDAPRRRLFRIDRSCFHMECSSVESARRQCTCTGATLPPIDHGRCVRCQLHRDSRRHPAQTAAYLVLKSIPYGTFDRAIYEQALPLFEQARAAERAEAS